MTAPENNLPKMNPSKMRVEKAYYGGKTEKEALESTRMRITKGQKKGQVAPFPDVRQHRKYRKELENEGRLLKMKPEPGERACRWIAKDSIVGSDYLSSKVESGKIESKSIPTTINDSKGQYNDKILVLQLMARFWDFSAFINNIDGIMEEIQKDESWRKRRRINRICNDMIAPLVKALFHARHEWGFKITLPPEYFPTKPKRIYHGLFGDTDLRGSLAVAMVDPKDGILGSIFPGLEDWRDYLLLAKDEIIKILDTEPFPQLAELDKKRKRLGLSGYDLLLPLFVNDEEKTSKML